MAEQRGPTAEQPVTIIKSLRTGGIATVATLATLNSLDEIEFAALVVLSPDIAATLDVSHATITFVIAASLLFLAVGAAFVGWLADKYRRATVIGWAAMAAAAGTALTGVATNAALLFAARSAAGFAKAGAATAQPSLLADAYPRQSRGRVFAAYQGSGRIVGLSVGPVVIAAVAVGLGGSGWRWIFAVAALLTLGVAVWAFRLPEPPRGQWERQQLFGRADENQAAPATSAEAAFAEVWRIRTVKCFVGGLVAMGIVLIPARVVEVLYLNDEYNLNALGRALATAPGAIGLLFALPLVGRRFDTAYRNDPRGAFKLVGMLLAPVAVLVPLQYLMPNLPLFVCVGAVGATFLGAAFSMVQPALQAVLPHNRRGTGAAIAAVSLVAAGGMGGSLILRFLESEFGEKTAISVIALVAVALGVWLISRAAALLHSDLGLVESQLREQHTEHELRLSGTPEDVPVLQATDINFSYGHVQVLFDFDLKVMKGETVAVIGANGAGKSTAFRVIAGLGIPSGGTVRLNGQAITFASAEDRSHMGVQMLPGGQGVWPRLSVEDNLILGADAYRSDKADQARRIRAALEHFPAIADRRKSRADELSGGMQQQLALARVMLHDPEILLIDELSLGLAPVVVDSLREVVEGLKSSGQTMVIIEQSVSIALSIADRAVFMEKGRVHFEGTAAEFRDNPQLAQTVFFREEPK